MERVIVNDVGPRDGLQNDPATVSPADRAGLIRDLVAAGVPAVEAVSFVSPKAVPKMAGAAEVIAALDLDAADFSALIPNRKGYELAREAGVRSVAVVLSATDTMNRKNINMDLDTTVRVCSEILEQASRDGVNGRAYVSVALGCPYEGDVPEDRIRDLTRTMFDAGATEVIVADTIGAGNPAQVKSLFSRLVPDFGADRLSAHFHDTRALALANAWQALECGIRKFDASIGGLGGCPFAPGAAGNLATEDLVSLLHQAGFDTGIDLDALLAVVDRVRELVGHPVGGRALAWLHNHRAAAAAAG
ncbi:MAG: hydroxymethylglutaryl-CoA lyase [Gammaproteobacteria bacterium]|nr:hydroxymethylglutaryl-CoA lyase [Gammaproteobacteria bacterium]MBK81409.1 hydroxymethylglutaryl-CoA lyase [Gammaproteobacteria bacterium]|tara:strand:- start:4149 stop:5060 length:912 start_codon:yes stop_codon:yes gene_type:complete